MTKDLLRHLWSHIVLKLNGKVDKEDGKGLSSNDYTNTEKSKLSSIEDNANNYTHPKTHSVDMITGLANVAKSGDYNDLSNQPVIPTIPSSLPADGGNADTVDNKHADDFADVNHTHSQEDITGLSDSLNSKADNSHIHIISDVTGLSGELNSKYEKPESGIPKSDLASDVQNSLSKADTALQSISGYATETYVDNKVAGIVGSAPETLDTLNELAAALGDDPNFATTVATQIGGKVDKEDGKGLSSNDYTTTEKNKLAGIETGANKTVVDSALSSTSINPVQNKVVNSALSNKADTSHTHSEYINQNAFSSVIVGSTTVAADTATDTLKLVAGDNVTITPDATNDKITISSTDTIIKWGSF